MQNPPSQRVLLIMLVSAMLIWGLNWPVMKVIVTHIPPVAFIFIRTLLSAIVIGIYLALSKQWGWPGRRDWILIVVVGVLQFALCNFIMIDSLQYVETSRAAILSYCSPILVTPIAILVFKENCNAVKLIGVILGTVGILTMLSPLTFDWHNTTELYASIWLLIAAAIWAGVILMLRQLKSNFPTLGLVFWQLLVAAAVTTIPTFHTHLSDFHITATVIGCGVYAIVFATLFTYSAMVLTSQYLPSITTSLSLLITPVSGMFFSWLFLHESLMISTITAMAFITVGIIVAALSDRLMPERDEEITELAT